MSRYSNDFYLWDEDLDLDELLGEYTADEFEIDASKKKESVVVYACPDCAKEYKSISGFRGHVLKKHHKSLRATEHVKGGVLRPSGIDEEEKGKFEEIFPAAYKQSMSSLRTNPLYNIFGDSAHPQIAESCQNSDELKLFFKEIMQKCFKGNKGVTVAEREVLFKTLHECRTDSEFLSEGSDAIKKCLKGVSNADSNNFIQDFMLDLIGEIFKERVKLGTKEKEPQNSQLTDSENKIVYYISGYIIYSLEKKYRAMKNKTAREKRMQDISVLTKPSSENTFTDKFQTWYDRKNRGGLKKLCDDFFFMVREFETTARKNEHLSEPKEVVKEKMLDSYMVNHYAGKLFPKSGDEEDPESTYVEDSVNVFVTVRGFARSKFLNKQYRKIGGRTEKSSESLRGTLKSLSNNKN